MKIYEVTFYCQGCGEYLEKNTLIKDIHISKGDAFDGLCLRCDNEEFKVHSIDKRRILSGDQIIPWMKKIEKKSGSEGLYLLNDWVTYEGKKRKIKEGLQVEVIEFSISPVDSCVENENDWLTMTDIAERYGISKETVKTHKKRKKFAVAEEKGMTRKNGVWSVHISAVKEIYEQIMSMNPKMNP